MDVRKYDLVHIHAWWNLVSVLSALVAVLRKVPVVVSPRGTLSAYSFLNKNQRIKKLIHNLLGKPLLNKCNVHVTSAHEKLAMVNLIQPKNMIIIPNMVRLPLKQSENYFFRGLKKKKGWIYCSTHCL
jgi:hypothetical protein